SICRSCNGTGCFHLVINGYIYPAVEVVKNISGFIFYATADLIFTKRFKCIWWKPGVPVQYCLGGYVVSGECCCKRRFTQQRKFPEITQVAKALSCFRISSVFGNPECIA